MTFNIVSDEIPKAPISVRLYSLVRGVFSIPQTANYLLIESIVFGFAVLASLYISTPITPIIYGATMVGFLLLGLSIYLTVDPELRSNPTRVMDISTVKYILLLAVLLSAINGYGYMQESLSLVYYISSGGLGMYGLTVIGRSQKYKGERDYFTDKYSNANTDWERASVALERALDKREDSVNSSYFWAKRAESIYEGIIEEEDRIMQREAASAFATACGFIAASVFTHSNESYSYWKAAEKSMDRATDLLSVRVCDICGQKKPVGDCSATINDDGVREIYCQRCIEQQQAKQRNKARQKKASQSASDQSARQSRSSNSRDKNSSKKSGRNSSRSKQRTDAHNRSSSHDRGSSATDGSQDDVRMRGGGSDMTIQEAIETLELEEKPDSASDVHAAFRDTVKSAHPDMGGSEDEFKKVKKAREILVKEYE